MLVLSGSTATQARAPETPDLISLGAGSFDVLKNEPRNRAADFRLEYRFGEATSLLHLGSHVSLRPWAGAEVTSDGGLYGGGGLFLDLELGPLAITPSFGAGLHRDGGGKQLGSSMEFRSTIEVAYRFENESRLGVAFGHISNGGLTTLNPGVEVVTVYWHMPVDWL